jgi:DNA polymerase-3 subunit alpha
VAGAAAAGLRIFLDEAAAVPSLRIRLDAVAREPAARRAGPVVLVAMAGELGEVDLTLPDPYPLTPQVLGALKSVPGVVHIEEF